jgi:hypothetical protein
MRLFRHQPCGHWQYPVAVDRSFCMGMRLKTGSAQLQAESLWQRLEFHVQGTVTATRINEYSIIEHLLNRRERPGSLHSEQNFAGVKTRFYLKFPSCRSLRSRPYRLMRSQNAASVGGDFLGRKDPSHCPGHLRTEEWECADRHRGVAETVGGVRPDTSRRRSRSCQTDG